MFKKIALALSAAAMVAVPVAAEAQDYYGGYRQNCDGNTAAGAAIGGIAGAVLGSSVARGGHYSYRYGRYHHGDRTAGALIGGALGAVVGGAIASNSCY